MRHALSALLLLLLAACDTTTTDPPDDAQEGTTFLVVVEKGSYPDGPNVHPWCLTPVSAYSDANAGVPDNPAYGRTYGPVETGTFEAEMEWVGPSQSFRYTLEAPPPGIERTYTMTLVDFNVSLNRCVRNVTPNLRRRDREM